MRRLVKLPPQICGYACWSCCCCWCCWCCCCCCGGGGGRGCGCCCCCCCCCCCSCCSCCCWCCQHVKHIPKSRPTPPQWHQWSSPTHWFEEWSWSSSFLYEKFRFVFRMIRHPFPQDLLGGFDKSKENKKKMHLSNLYCILRNATVWRGCYSNPQLSLYDEVILWISGR